jgi:DNA-binding protein HU-beta
MPGKTELVERIAFETGMPKAHAARALEVMVDAVNEWLGAGERVVIPGLGSFYTSERHQRQVRNPRTGAVTTVAPSRTVRFRPGKELKGKVKG